MENKRSWSLLAVIDVCGTWRDGTNLTVARWKGGVVGNSTVYGVLRIRRYSVAGKQRQAKAKGIEKEKARGAAGQLGSWATGDRRR